MNLVDTPGEGFRATAWSPDGELYVMDLLKGEGFESFDRSIDVHVSRIRACIEDNPKKPRRVITVRAAGYVFAKAQD